MQLVYGAPLLFLLYTDELFDVVARSGLTGHSYAGDTHVYISAPVTSFKVHQCLNASNVLMGCVQQSAKGRTPIRAANLARYTTTIWQAFSYRAILAVC